MQQQILRMMKLQECVGSTSLFVTHWCVSTPKTLAGFSKRPIQKGLCRQSPISRRAWNSWTFHEGPRHHGTIARHKGPSQSIGATPHRKPCETSHRGQLAQAQKHCRHGKFEVVSLQFWKQQVEITATVNPNKTIWRYLDKKRTNFRN